MGLIYNPKSTKQLRRILRSEPISAEQLMWRKLRRRQLDFRFNRQYGIGKYIVDFYCAEKRLVIEIDGMTHETDKQINNDKIRENYFKKLGLTVKRFTNADVYHNLDAVLDEIYEIVHEIK